jgi:hypothetical protein
VSRTGIRHADKSQSLDHIIRLDGIVEWAHLHAVHHTLANTRLADHGVADARLRKPTRHGIGVGPRAEGPGLQKARADAEAWRVDGLRWSRR